MNAVHDERGLTDVSQVRETIACKFLPVAKRCHLSSGHRRSGTRVPILFALRKPFDEGCTSCLARLGRRKEDLLQKRISSKIRIGEVLCQAGFLEKHDVLSSARCGADEDHPANDRGTILRHLLRDHSAQRESEDIAGRHAQSIQEGQSVLGHAGDCWGHWACGASDAGVVE